MPQLQHFYPADLHYTPDVLRSPSPSSTVGSHRSPDATSLSDSELDQDAFDRKCADIVRLHLPRPDEEAANKDPLVLPRPMRPIRSALEEKQLFDHTMKSLREAVQKLEEDEQFERSILPSMEAALEEQPSSGDLDAIMKSLMTMSTAGSSPASRTHSLVRSGPATPQWLPPAHPLMAPPDPSSLGVALESTPAMHERRSAW